MKKLAISSIVCLAMAATAFGQGSVRFANSGTGWAARIYDDPSNISATFTGVTPSGSAVPIPGGQNYAAQMFGYNPNTSSWVPLLNAANQPGIVDFFTTPTSAYGYLNVGSDSARYVPWVTVQGQTAQVTIRVWNHADVYTSWDAAYAAWQAGTPGVRIGEATPITVTPGVTPTPTYIIPAPGFASFAIVSGVPEPSTLALGMLGVAGLLFFRRK